MYYCEETGDFIHPIFFNADEEAREVKSLEPEVNSVSTCLICLKELSRQRGEVFGSARHALPNTGVFGAVGTHVSDACHSGGSRRAKRVQSICRLVLPLVVLHRASVVHAVSLATRTLCSVLFFGTGGAR